METKLWCYVRTFRSRWALTQPELAKLLGISPQQVSRIEDGRRKPTAWTLLACHLVFGGELRDLFPGLWEKVEDDVVRELYRFQQRLEKRTSEKATRKRQLVEDALDRAVKSGNVLQEA